MSTLIKKTLKKFSLILPLVLLSLSTYTMNAFSAQVSQAQMEQFQKLPAAQQKALAKSMGYDLEAITKQFSGGSDTTTLQENTKSYPRDTKFDPKGEAIQGSTDNSSIKNIKETDFGQVKKLKPFGYEVFANEPQTFAPIMDIAIPSHYIV
ncbi:MAG: polysaccharide biosynthesis/export protein, partial [Colwellia sp.]